KIPVNGHLTAGNLDGGALRPLRVLKGAR
ncbi:hypothetical protein EDF48_101652, partial [Curtobacterium sp. PhB191]